MIDRDEKILRAAQEVFSKFGVAKTTMNDIAAEAGVARQTVYNRFPGKPQILRAATRMAIQDFQAKVRQEWDVVEGFSAKIDAFYEHGPLLWYQMMTGAPELAELFDGINEHASVEVTEGAGNWTTMFVEMFEKEGLSSAYEDVSLRDAAEFFYFSSINAKYTASSVEVLEARLKTVKIALSSLLQKS
ncbi:MAG: TetR/AcrR family transcriptional regulator [Pseudomonadota bacterium]